MKIFMFDQVHLNRRYLEQEHVQSRQERLENLLCIIGVVIATVAAVATVIDVISTQNDSVYFDSSAYLYDPGQE